MKKNVIIAIILLSLLITLTSCGNSASTPSYSLRAPSTHSQTIITTTSNTAQTTPSGDEGVEKNLSTESVTSPGQEISEVPVPSVEASASEPAFHEIEVTIPSNDSTEAESSIDSSSISEVQGVPDAIVLFDFTSKLYDLKDNYQYELIHDIVSKGHIDIVTINEYIETEYAKQMRSIDFCYEYLSDSDTWQFVEYNNWVPSTELTNIFTELIPYRGEQNVPNNDHDCIFTFYIDEIDTINQSITLDYQIEYTSGVVSSNGNEVLLLEYFEDYLCYVFSIDVSPLFGSSWSGDPYYEVFQIDHNGITSFSERFT